MKTRQRSTGINIRVTEKEKNKIMLNAKRCNLSISEYLRQLAQNHEPRAVVDERLYSNCRSLQQIIAELQEEKLRTELERILSNLYEICYQESEVKEDGNYEDMAGSRQP